MPQGVAETSFASVVLIQGGSVAGRTDLSSRGMTDEGREGNPLPPAGLGAGPLRRKKPMYSLVTREYTIRIPAEYIRAGRKLEDHIDELAYDAFEGRFDENEDYTLLTFDHEAVDRGRIIHGDGAIYQNVRFKALIFTMENNEVVDGAYPRSRSTVRSSGLDLSRLYSTSRRSLTSQSKSASVSKTSALRALRAASISRRGRLSARGLSRSQSTRTTPATPR